MDSPCDLNELFERLVKQIQDSVDLADEGKSHFTPIQIFDTA